MVKRNKIILISIASIVLAFIIAASALIVFFPSEKIRKLAETEGSSVLGMPVSIKQLRISFLGLPSISAKDIKIGPAAGAVKPMAEIGSLKTGINLLKIIKGEIEITSIKIDKVSFNYIIPPKDTTAVDSLKPKKQAGLPMLPLPLTLRHLEIKHGKVEIVNIPSKNTILLDNISQSLNLKINKKLTSVNSKGNIKIGNALITSVDSTGAKKTVADGITVSFTHKLEGDPSAGDLSLTESTLVIGKIKANVNASVKGWQKTEFSLETGDLDASELLESFPASVFPDKGKVSAKGNFRFSVKGTFDSIAEKDALAFTGTVNTDIKDIVYKGLPKKIDSVVIDTGFTEKTLALNNIDIKAGSSKISVRGKVDSYLEKPVLDVKMNGNIEIQDLKDALPSLAKSKINGGLDINLSVNGATKEPSSMSADGLIKFRSFVFEMPKTLKNPSQLTGTVTIKPDKASIENLKMISGKSDLNFNGYLTNYMYIPYPMKGVSSNLKGKLSSNMIDVFDMIVVDKNVPAPKPWDIEQTIKTAPIPPTLAAETEIALGKIIMGKIKFDSAKGMIGLKEGKLSLSKLVVSAYNGALTGDTVMDFSDFKNVTYNGGFALNGFDSGVFISDFFGSKNFMKGKLSTNISFAGAGLDSVSMLKNLTGEGNMKFENGEISGWDFTDKLGTFLKFANFKGFTFDTIANNFIIKDRKIYTPDMVAKTEYGSIKLDGNTGFDKALDYKMTLTLTKTYSEKAVKELDILSKIPGVQTSALDLVVNAKGTLNSPKFTLNTEGVKKQIKNEIKTKTEQIIDKNIKNNDELKKTGKKLLNKLFK